MTGAGEICKVPKTSLDGSMQTLEAALKKGPQHVDRPQLRIAPSLWFRSSKRAWEVKGQGPDEICAG